MNSIIRLPDLLTYKQEIEAKGIHLPLSLVNGNDRGLLRQLPKPLTNKIGWPWDNETSPNIYDGRTEWPKITIVTPSYNQGHFIEQTIRSILLQNYPNLEYIIIDGGSSDETIEILKAYSPWISYFQSEKDAGQSQAINRGFSLASGAYYAWINSDDYYMEGVFKLVVDSFLRRKADFIYGHGLNYYKQDDRTEYIKVQRYFDLFIRIPTLFQPSCFWRKEIHQPLWEELHCSLDYELWLRMVRGTRRVLIPKPLSTAHVHDAAKTSDLKMGATWRKDHELICDTRAHGPILHWKMLMLINQAYLKFMQFFDKTLSH